MSMDHIGGYFWGLGLGVSLGYTTVLFGSKAVHAGLLGDDLSSAGIGEFDGAGPWDGWRWDAKVRREIG